MPWPSRMTRNAQPIGRHLLLACCGLLAILSTPAASFQPQLTPVYSLMDRHELPHSALSIAAVPLNGAGEARLANSSAAFNPGSIMKVLTSFAALELLGPNFQWHSRFYTDGELIDGVLEGNLYFQAAGDPKLTEERLWLILRELRFTGIHTIRGHLVLDNSAFNLPHGLPAFADSGNDPHRPFLVEPDALLTNLNLVQVRLRSSGDQVHGWIEPPMAGVVLDNQLTLTTNGPCPNRHQLHFIPKTEKTGAVTVTVSGRFPAHCQLNNYLSVLPQDQYTAELLFSLWHALGGHWDGGFAIGNVPEGSRLLATSSSPDLVTMVRDVNKWSNNVMARQIFLTLGAKYRQESDRDDLQAARRTVHEWLTSKGLNTTSLYIDNGSGLSRDSRISANLMVELLQHAWQSPYAAELVASLPLVAMDGTMRRRLTGTNLVGRGHIKTGTLKDVRSIAGFTRDENNTTWAVVAMVNHPRANRSEAALDSLLKQIHLASRQAPLTTAQRHQDSDTLSQ